MLKKMPQYQKELSKVGAKVTTDNSVHGILNLRICLPHYSKLWSHLIMML